MQNNTFLTLFVGQTIVKLSQVDSTNTYVKKLLSNSKPLLEGTVIMADHQFAGRGQSSNVWQSNAGQNLTVSIYLKPNFLQANNQFELNKTICLGITDYLISLLGDDCKIKWPNDIYYRDQKIGGILIENITKGYQLKDSIIGIGLNINQKEFNLENGRASSLSKILHQDYDLEKLLAQLCKSIETRYLQLKAEKLSIINKDYVERLYRLNEQKTFQIDNKKVLGIIKGVNKNGFLIVELPNQTKEFDLKEITFIFD